MRNIFMPLLVGLFINSLIAQQSTISGVISLHNSEFETGKRQYVTNAQVEDDFQKANAQLSDANGIFKLIFVGVPEKTTVNLIIKKDGLEVVNIDALGAVTGQRDQVRLSMAEPNKIAEYRRKIYTIGKTEAEKNLAALLQKKGNEIEALQKDAKTNAAKIQSLQSEYATLYEQYKIIEEQAQELARKYAPINLDDASPLYREAFRYFQKGELDQALKILQQANLAQQAKKILQERENIENVRKDADLRDSIQQQRTEDVIKALQFKADLHKNRYEFDSTLFCFELMLQLDSMNINALWSYASFLDFQNQSQKAIALYKKLLLIAKTDDQKSAFLNNLGGLFTDNNMFSQADSVLNESLQIQTRLAAENPDAFLPSLAGNLNNLGVLYDNLNQMELAENAYLKALQIRRQLANKNPNIFLPDVAETLNNLGALYKVNHEMTKTESAYLEALKIRRQLAEQYPQFFLEDVATTLNNLGIHYYESHKMPEAESAYLEALKIQRQLATQNPNTFLPTMATLLNNLGAYYYVNKKMPQAESAYLEALQIRRELATKNVNEFLPDIAICLNNLGIIYDVTKKTSQAERAYLEALQIHRQLAAKSPDAFLSFVAGDLNNLGSFYRENQKLPQAGSAYKESCQIYKQLVSKNSEAFLPFLAIALTNLGDYYSFNKEILPAENAYIEALQVIRVLATKNPDAFLPHLAHNLNNLGVYYLNNQKLPKAKNTLEESLQIRKQMAAKNPDAFLTELATTLYNNGLYYKLLNNYEQALGHFIEALKIREQAILQGNTYYIQDWMQILKGINDLGNYAITTQDYTKVFNVMRLLAESFDLFKELDVQIFQNTFGAYYNLSWVSLLTKNFAFSESSALRCLELDNSQEWVLINLGHSFLFRGQFSQAQNTYERLKGKKDNLGKDYKQAILDSFLKLEQENITHPDLPKMKAWIESW